MTKFWRALLFAGALLASACGPSVETQFQDRIAREALACLHPRGEFQSAGEVKSEGNGVYTGTIYWHGRALDNNYYTKVRMKIEDHLATFFVVEESSLMPAVHQNCQVRVEGP
jgi:hypothetical protein